MGFSLHKEDNYGQTKLPYYLPVGDEVEVFTAAFKARMAVLLKGPTGCGKTRFVRHMAVKLGLSVNTVACHDDLTGSDLLGRFLIKGADTLWVDGPLTSSVRKGGICYLDEVVEARKDTTVIIHPLTDDRRILTIDKTGEELSAPDDFMLVVSYNPGYQHILKDLKPSTRQRFVALEFDYPPEDLEVRIVMEESGLDEKRSSAIVSAGRKMRLLTEEGLDSPPCTRLLVHAARLVNNGLAPATAVLTAIIRPVTDDAETIGAMLDIAKAIL